MQVAEIIIFYGKGPFIAADDLVTQRAKKSSAMVFT